MIESPMAVTLVPKGIGFGTGFGNWPCVGFFGVKLELGADFGATGFDGNFALGTCFGAAGFGVGVVIVCFGADFWFGVVVDGASFVL